MSAKIATLKTGRPSESMPIGMVSQTEAAKMMNVGHRSVLRATAVRNHGVKELQAAVESGDASLWAAAEIARQPQEEQRVIVSRGEKRFQSVAI